MSKKKVTAPLTYDPGKGRPKEHLAYLNWQEMQALKRLNGNNQERGPMGLPSFPPGGTTGKSSSSSSSKSSSSNKSYGGGGKMGSSSSQSGGVKSSSKSSTASKSTGGGGKMGASSSQSGGLSRSNAAGRDSGAGRVGGGDRGGGTAGPRSGVSGSRSPTSGSTTGSGKGPSMSKDTGGKSPAPRSGLAGTRSPTSGSKFSSSGQKPGGIADLGSGKRAAGDTPGARVKGAIEGVKKSAAATAENLARQRQRAVADQIARTGPFGPTAYGGVYNPATGRFDGRPVASTQVVNRVGKSDLAQSVNRVGKGDIAQTVDRAGKVSLPAMQKGDLPAGVSYTAAAPSGVYGPRQAPPGTGYLRDLSRIGTAPSISGPLSESFSARPYAEVTETGIRFNTPKVDRSAEPESPVNRADKVDLPSRASTYSGYGFNEASPIQQQAIDRGLYNSSVESIVRDSPPAKTRGLTEISIPGGGLPEAQVQADRVVRFSKLAEKAIPKNMAEKIFANPNIRFPSMEKYASSVGENIPDSVFMNKAVPMNSVVPEEKILKVENVPESSFVGLVGEEARKAAKEYGIPESVIRSPGFLDDPTRLGVMPTRQPRLSATDMAKLHAKAYEGNYLTPAERTQAAVTKGILRGGRMALNATLPLSGTAAAGVGKLVDAEPVESFLGRPSYEQSYLRDLAKAEDVRYGRDPMGRTSYTMADGTVVNYEGPKIGQGGGGRDSGIAALPSRSETVAPTPTESTTGTKPKGPRPAIYYQWDLGVNIPSPSDPNYTQYQTYLAERAAAQAAMYG